MLRVISRDKGRTGVRVHADAVLFTRPDYGRVMEVHAMSLLGGEQSIRAIGAGCSAEHDAQRCTLDFYSGETVLNGRWVGRWNHQSIRLTTGVMHMVAMPAVSATMDVAAEGTMSGHVVIAPSAEQLRREIYRRLLLAYSTPLLPIEMPGQSDEERRHAEIWAVRVVDAVMNLGAPTWRPLTLHPDSLDRTWEHAGVLSIGPEKLDKIVADLVKFGSINIPEAA